jgi:hypothetical protein
MDNITPINQILYNKKTILVSSILAFTPSSKEKNDENNIMRENMIGAIVNEKIPMEYYESSKDWSCLKNSIEKYTRELVDQRPFQKVDCIHMAGRNHNYDFRFDVLFVNHIKESFPIELKFNVSRIEDTPQYVSPMKPSQYLSYSYEEYYYSHYLPLLCVVFELAIPPKDIWLKQIHSNTPACMIEFKKKYDQGCKSSSKFTNKEEDILCYETAKKLAKESIVNFIRIADLNIELLSNYLLKTQENKHYMLYCTNEKDFKLQHVNKEDYMITSVIKNPELNRYECMTQSEKKMKVLLRWKNGNGIAFPAFQIS